MASKFRMGQKVKLPRYTTPKIGVIVGIIKYSDAFAAMTFKSYLRSLDKTEYWVAYESNGNRIEREKFQEVHEFRFTDFDYMDVKILYNRNPEKDPKVISENDAKEIIKILNKALLENKNVTVHC